MSGRPKHVATLSDKISGLKFMQRAKAVVEKADLKKAGESSKSTLNVTDIHGHSEKDTFEEVSPRYAVDENEEHWILPARDADQKLKRKASVSSHVSPEPGWNAWLLEADEVDLVEGDDGSESARRVYGSWSKKSKKREKGLKAPSSGKQKINGSLETRGATDLSEQTDSSISDSDIAVKDLKTSGFIKPGSLSDKDKKEKDAKKRDNPQNKKRLHDSTDRSGNENSSRRKKDRKISSRPLLSGFSKLK